MKTILYPTVALALAVSACCAPCNNNPATLLKTDAQRAMAANLRDIADGHLYSMDYNADYFLNEVMEQGGAKSNEDLLKIIIPMLVNLPQAAPSGDPEFGCSAFCVKSPEGDVLVGRNFDYRFVSSSNIVVHNITPGARESMCISAMPYLDKDLYVAGALSDGTTDISIPVAASIYCCLDGMNDAGLFIGVLSLRGGGAVQHDPAKSDVMTSLAIRLTLDKCATVDEAVEMFRNHNFFADGENSEFNYHFLLADASGKAVVVEYWRPGEDAPVADASAKDWTLNVLDEDHVTNFYLTPDWSNLGVGQARYDSLATTMDRKARIMTEDECMALLDVVHTDLNSEGGEITSNTQWSVVYNLTKKTATVCVDKDYGRKLNFSL